MLGNKYVAIAVGILLLIVVAYNARKFFPGDKQPGSTVAHVAATARPPEHEPGAMPERIVDGEDKGQWKRDPFALKRDMQVKTVEKEPEKPPLDIRLMGIIKRDGRSHALINGKVYRIHDEFDDAIIKEIKQHSIVLLSEGEIQEVSFEDYIVVKEKAK